MDRLTSGTNAYWSTGEGFADVIGLTVRVLELRGSAGCSWPIVDAADHSTRLEVSFSHL